MSPFLYFDKSSLAFGSSFGFLLLYLTHVSVFVKPFAFLKSSLVIRYPCCILFCGQFFVDLLALLDNLPDSVCATTELLKLTFSHHFAENDACDLS